jgi:predicted AlkP superfamily phosphohydrolase/phosphomutase
MNPTRKVLLLAVDAANKDLLREWAADGTLPNIRSLLSRALAGDSAGVEGLYEGSTWPCFYTGVNPGRHGFHNWRQIQPGTYEFSRRYPGEFIREEPFWERLSKAGKRVAILDVPLSGLSRGLNGIQTVEWGSHDAVYGFQTWPPGLSEEVTSRFGSHPLGPSCNSAGRSPEDFRRFRDCLIEGVKRKCELTLHYLDEGPWDFFAQVFTESHCVGHQCWHLHDPAHPNYDAGTVALTGDPLRDVYRAIDDAVGKILAHVDGETVVFFVVAHGMAHNVGADFLLEEGLARLGVLTRVSPSATGVLRRRWNRLPGPVRAMIKPVLLPLRRGAGPHDGAGGVPQLPPWIDLARSKCFPYDNGYRVSGIRLNVAGREPTGVLEPGGALDEFCRRISDDLLAIVDTETGKPIVERVIKTSDRFHGDRVDHLPDLLLDWNEDVQIGSTGVRDGVARPLRLTSDLIGTLEGQCSYCRTGDHRPDGLFAVAGPGTRPGTLDGMVSIMDFAPTLLRLFGLGVDDLDGEPIAEVLKAIS